MYNGSTGFRPLSPEPLHFRILPKDAKIPTARFITWTVVSVVHALASTMDDGAISQ